MLGLKLKRRGKSSPWDENRRQSIDIALRARYLDDLARGYENGEGDCD